MPEAFARGGTTAAQALNGAMAFLPLARVNPLDRALEATGAALPRGEAADPRLSAEPGTIGPEAAAKQASGTPPAPFAEPLLPSRAA
ncbi:hypothetical protein DNK34_03045 [Pseudomonas dryadis]|uniref:Uncharacterized protein n=1 Tax=Phytopseudomonas dryadis TaxID=2487520 RepID=A0ABY1ZAN8_9GAMM|nr:hypothetical protein DNK34_03045 [Pseudomonas dryadis]TBV15106.1 hypothetical protein DNK41_18605 [Pseudomonas sp. FRB 230]